MKAIYFITVLLFSLALPLASHAERVSDVKDNACKSDKWLNGWDGFQEAHKLRKDNSCKTFVYFRSDFCAPCKILKKKIFGEGEFFTRSPNVTKIKLEFPGSWQERRLAEKFGVIGAPSIFIMEKQDSGKSESTEIRFHNIDESRNGFKFVSIDEALELINGPSVK